MNRARRSRGTRVVWFYCSYISVHGKEENHGSKKKKIIGLKNSGIGQGKANMTLSTCSFYESLTRIRAPADSLL